VIVHNTCHGALGIMQKRAATSSSLLESLSIMSGSKSSSADRTLALTTFLLAACAGELVVVGRASPAGWLAVSASNVAICFSTRAALTAFWHVHGVSDTHI
jgi:hypothetical protein